MFNNYSPTEKKEFARKFISYTILAIILSFFVYYIYTHFSDFKALLNINPLWIFPIAIIFLCSTVVNGVIFKTIMIPFHVTLKPKEWYGLSIVTSFYNLITPFRGGAVARAVYLKKHHSFSYTNFIATMLGVYVIQFFIITLVGMINLYFIYKYHNVFSLPVFIILFCIFAILTSVIFFNVRFPFSLNPILNKLFEIGNGWNIVRNNEKILFVSIVAIIIQLMLGVSGTMIIYTAIGIKLTVVQALFLVTISSLAGLVSITPGNLGFAEAVSVLSALVLGISPVQSLSASIVNRAISTIIFFILGPIFSYILLRKKDY